MCDSDHIFFSSMKDIMVSPASIDWLCWLVCYPKCYEANFDKRWKSGAWPREEPMKLWCRSGVRVRNFD